MPSEGYDAMSKVTVSLANIPTAFYMYASDGTNVDMITNVRPEDVVLDNPIKIRRAYNNEYLLEDAVVTAADDTSITVTANAFEATYIFIGALNI